MLVIFIDMCFYFEENSRWTGNSWWSKVVIFRNNIYLCAVILP